MKTVKLICQNCGANLDIKDNIVFCSYCGAKLVYDAARFSDPISNDAFATAESQITVNFEELKMAVKEDDIEAVKSLAKTVLILLKYRNNKCKLLK